MGEGTRVVRLLSFTAAQCAPIECQTEDSGARAVGVFLSEHPPKRTSHRAGLPRERQKER